MSMTDKQQTAVEWLLNILITENQITLKGENYKLFDLAMKMEKEQIEAAYRADTYPCSDEDAEQYYNETYQKP